MKRKGISLILALVLLLSLGRLRREADACGRRREAGGRDLRRDA